MARDFHFIFRGDALHILFCKGVFSHLLGSVLHFPVFQEGQGTQNKTALRKTCSSVGSLAKGPSKAVRVLICREGLGCPSDLSP